MQTISYLLMLIKGSNSKIEMYHKNYLVNIVYGKLSLIY